MMTFGDKLRMTLFGASHAPSVGVRIEGVPAGMPLSESVFECDLSRRRAGAAGTTARHERDLPHIRGGVTGGVTDGSTIEIEFMNEDVRSSDYDTFRIQPRPSHAAFAARAKYGDAVDLRGGGIFSGRMTLPRELRVQNGRLYQTPVREIETLWHDKVELTGVTVEGCAALPGIGGRSVDLTVRVDAAASPACRRFTLRFAAGGALYNEIRCDLDRGELAFDRSHGGSRRDCAHTRHIQAAPKDGVLTLRLILDKDCAELFVNDGERALSAVLDTPPEAQGITFAAEGGALRLDAVQYTLG